MDFSYALAIFGFVWHLFAIANLIMLAPYGKRWEGFYLGVLFGPFGTFISIIIREKAKEAQERGES
jgi:pilus assembly protein TadC